MSSAGVMASSVYITGTCTSVLQEPFNTLSNWANPSGQWGIYNGAIRSPGCAQGSGDPNTGTLRYSIPAGNQLDTITVGMAWQPVDLNAQRVVGRLESDAGATSHIYIVAFSNGSLNLRYTGTAGPILLATAAGVISAAAWNYIEIKAKLHDTAGSLTLQVNGGPLLTANNIDTKAGGTKTVWDTVCLMTSAPGVTTWVDDLYISVGPDCTFIGDHVIP